MSIFGLIVSGRLVDTDFQQADPNKLLKTIVDPDNINHIVVFMTGAQPLPDGFGAAVYLSLPTDGAGSWQYLGYICNAKPSAIFKISKHHVVSDFGDHAFSSQQHMTSVAQIGLSIEPLTQIKFQDSGRSSEQNLQDSYSEFCTRMLENFFNYASSFSVMPAQISTNESFVPLKTLSDWYNSFKRRFQQNPNFWKQG